MDWIYGNHWNNRTDWTDWKYRLDWKYWTARCAG
jgi:hypothetical protein